MASIRDNVVKTLAYTMKRHDGGPSHERIMSAYLDDLAKHGKGQVPDAVPSIAFVAMTHQIDTPTTGDVVEAKKTGEGIFVLWKQGVSAICYDRGWGFYFTAIFENQRLSVQRKTLVNLKKDVRTPAMELAYPAWDKGVVVGFKVRNAPTHNEAQTVKTIDFIAEHTGPDAVIE